MKYLNAFQIIIFLCCAFLTTIPVSSATYFSPQPSESFIQSPAPKTNSFSYDNQSPLTIIGNTALNSYASQFNWPGNGSASNPFVIEFYSINVKDSGTVGIYLEQVSSFVLIQKNLFFASPDGSVGHSSNSAGSYGIIMSSCSNIIVQNNFLSNFTAFGVAITDGYGYNSSSNIIVDNNVFSSDLSASGGINIARSNNITLTNNEISYLYNAINVFVGDNLTISYNNLNFNNKGLMLSYVTNSVISLNIIAGNGNYGLMFDGVASKFYVNGTLVKGFIPNYVTNNDFISNNLDNYYPPNTSQALDVGRDDVNNWYHNYWDNFPNYESSQSYRINRSLGLNEFSFDSDPSHQPIRATNSFVQIVESMAISTTITSLPTGSYIQSAFFFFIVIMLFIAVYFVSKQKK